MVAGFVAEHVRWIPPGAAAGEAVGGFAVGEAGEAEAGEGEGEDAPWGRGEERG